MSNWKIHFFEILIALGCMVCISLLGLFVIFGGIERGGEGANPTIPPHHSFESLNATARETVAIGVPTTMELVQKLTQTSGSHVVTGAEGDSGPPPLWLTEFESLAGNPPLDEARVIRLWAFIEAMPDGERKSVFYAMIADQADPTTFQKVIWPKVWNPSTPPDESRIIANIVPKLPEDIMFPYLLALLQHPDEETQAIARGVLWGYFPDVHESEYPRAIQYRNFR